MDVLVLSNAQALDAIAELLDGKEWSPDTTDAIADIVRRSGREVRDVADVKPEWLYGEQA